MLKKILGEAIKESPEEFQEWLSALSKEQLIAEMLRKKESGAWKSDDGSGDESDLGSKEGGKDKEKRKEDNNGGGDIGWGADASAGATGNGGGTGHWQTPAATGDSSWGVPLPTSGW